jgi:hypothetical protein
MLPHPGSFPCKAPSCALEPGAKPFTSVLCNGRRMRLRHDLDAFEPLCAWNMANGALIDMPFFVHSLVPGHLFDLGSPQPHVSPCCAAHRVSRGRLRYDEAPAQRCARGAAIRDTLSACFHSSVPIQLVFRSFLCSYFS